jgi:hypothetical protein
LVVLRTQREAASANLEFESAAALHAQVQRVESVRALAAELVRPLSRLRAVILQASANADEVAVYLYENGRLRGPAQFSTLGMRIQNEQSGSTSLFAQPMAIEPVPEAPGLEAEPEEKISSGAKAPVNSADLVRGLKPPPPSDSSSSAICNSAGFEVQASETDAPVKLARGTLESRMEAALGELADTSQAPSQTVRQGHLALLKRWYYRPEARRTGEIFFPDSEDRWPVKALLRGVGRVAAKTLTAANRD